MFKKFICVSLILGSFSAFAGGKEGLHIRYNIESESGSTPNRSIVDYYYQNGNFMAVVKSLEPAMDDMIFLDKAGQKYVLSSKDKTFIEVKEFEASLSTFQPETEGTFAVTKIKKKILGYKCDVHHKESPTGTTNVCMSQKLYKNWAAFSSLIEPKNSSVGQIPGFPLEVVTLTDGMKKQTSIVMSQVRQKDYSKRFEILSSYKKKDTADVQKSSTKMLNTMPSTAPKSQKEYNDVEKLTEDAAKKYGKSE